ncbi:MAG: RDD family protein [Halofilum sp. (in: g-proteobacteria)]|nr:RDD family protein [Halofilum sp. (in: g-proteobacteria)]
MADDVIYSTLPRRLGAAAIDGLIIGALIGFVALQQPGEGPQADWVGLLVLGSALSMFYRMVSEGSRLQGTPGKYLVGLKAVHTDGRTMMFVGSALRSWPWWLTGALGALVPSLMPAVGALCVLALLPILWDEQRRGLHDRMAGTVVVSRDSVLAPPEPDV